MFFSVFLLLHCYTFFALFNVEIEHGVDVSHGELRANGFIGQLYGLKEYAALALGIVAAHEHVFARFKFGAQCCGIESKLALLIGFNAFELQRQ